jgi:hypothetical protein
MGDIDLTSLVLAEPSPDSIYHALDKSEAEIRLFQILPSTSKDSIVECTLSNYNLNKEPQFTALSYAWYVNFLETVLSPLSQFL